MAFKTAYFRLLFSVASEQFRENRMRILSSPTRIDRGGVGPCLSDSLLNKRKEGNLVDWFRLDARKSTWGFCRSVWVAEERVYLRVDLQQCLWRVWCGYAVSIVDSDCRQVYRSHDSRRACTVDVGVAPVSIGCSIVGGDVCQVEDVYHTIIVEVSIADLIESARGRCWTIRTATHKVSV